MYEIAKVGQGAIVYLRQEERVLVSLTKSKLMSCKNMGLIR
jgi:GTP cyclohydrolase II